MNSLPPTPPEAWEPLLRFARIAGRPLERFLRIEAASGILLLVMTAIALIWGNSPWADSYDQVWHTPIGVQIGTFTFQRTAAWFVNDGLMVIFFFVVGIEIRREVSYGELSEWRRAALPMAAAIGGMLVPAGIYVAMAGAPLTRSGWGVPMATDIAFAVGILALLGKRVPAALRVLLLTLAVIDDLGAILVIAIFYSSGISGTGLLVASGGIGCVFIMQRVGVRTKLAYVFPALVVWAGTYASGIHPTIAGVVVGLMTPVRAWLGPQGFLIDVRNELERLGKATLGKLTSRELVGTLRHVEIAKREAISPAESLIDTLHPWVAFGIMPLFALANAGVSIWGAQFDSASFSVMSAVALGLLVGKPGGVLLISALVLRLKIATCPAGIGYRHLTVLGVVAGVGFTMALFIAHLAFKDASLLASAKLGILLASAIAAMLALLLGRVLLSPVPITGAAESADEAESSTEM